MVLAAGEGVRLRPLTISRPKALVPVGGRPLLAWAVDRLRPLTGDGPEAIAVNAHHLADQVVAWAREHDVTVSVEQPQALGTAGALARLRPWLAGRDALVTNADVYQPGGLGGFADGWDGERCRLLCRVAGPGERRDFGDLAYLGSCLLPWRRIAGLPEEIGGLYEVLWRQDAARDALDLVVTDALVIDCGTPERRLAADRHASGVPVPAAPEQPGDGRGGEAV